MNDLYPNFNKMNNEIVDEVWKGLRFEDIEFF